MGYFNARDGIIAVYGVDPFAQLFFLHFKFWPMSTARQKRQSGAHALGRIAHIGGLGNFGDIRASDL